MTQPTPAESLILRGLSILMRATFSPNNPEAQMKHSVRLLNDIGPWFADYVIVQAGESAPVSLAAAGVDIDKVAREVDEESTAAIVGGDTPHP